MQDDQPLKPANILNIVATNQGKRPLTNATPVAKPLSPAQVKAMMADGHAVSDGCAIVDARDSELFGAGHIPGAINVQLSSSEFEQRVGWMVPDDTPIILVTNTAEEAQRAIFNMAFIALDSFVVGYLDGGVTAWIKAGERLETVGQIDVNTLHHKLSTNGMRVLDVREDEEWDDGHIDGAHLMPYTHLVPQLTFPAQIDKLELTPTDHIAITCASGKRSSTAVSILKRHGYRHLYNVTGGMEAWEDAGLPMVDGEGNVCNI